MLIGHAKFVGMNLFLVCQDRALSVYNQDVVCCAPRLRLASISLWYCCNLSGVVALIVWFTTNGMCAKNKNISMWREQAIIEWSRRVISIVACCHGAKLCAHAPRDFRSQQNGAVTRMWRSCGVQPSHKERTIGVVRCKTEGILLQPLRWCCVDYMIHHERDMRYEQKYIYLAWTSNNRVISSGDLYCCLLPRCEILRTCRSGFPIATVYCDLV